MGFSISRGIKAFATGGLSEVPGMLGGKPDQTVNQQPLETPEQNAARKMLLEFARTGKYGDFTAGSEIPGYTPGGAIPGYTPGGALPGFTDPGARYSGPMGDYGMTGLEGAGQNKLASLISGGLPDIFNAGTDELTKLFSTDTYNPMSDTGIYKGLKERSALDTQDTVDAIKRNAAFGGTLYNSDTVRTIGRAETDSNLNLQNKLAELYDQFAQRRLDAIPVALGAGQTAENINQGRIGASQQYGGLSRILNDTDLQRQYAEYQRSRGEQVTEATRRRGEVTGDATRRNAEITADATRRRTEQLMPLNAVQSVAGQNAQFGVPSVTIPGTNPWDRVLDLLATGAGAALGKG